VAHGVSAVGWVAGPGDDLMDGCVCTCVQGIVVWLKGAPSLHAMRVSKDGLSKRPLLADGVAEGEDLYGAALKKVTTMMEERWVVQERSGEREYACVRACVCACVRVLV
jgi:hypothetical protein